ncbi:MAG: DUF5667 domain-containing protein [Candidatus Levybacteria bacterium]|nr:DUF5667 domain-containing protein [Candidatus Levybacteria bacterium]
MSKRLYVFLSLALTSLLILVSVGKANANHQAQVLGDSTTSADLSIPPTTEGPGLILPDSPLFFLDQLKQNFRLLLAFTPETRAKIYKDIAGERIAELRFMLAKNNLNAAKVALDGVASNLKNASAQVSQAKLTGRNVDTLAKTINDDIKAKQETLDILENQATGEVKSQVTSAQESLLKAKAEVEDSLQEQELKNEIKSDLIRKAERKVDNASDSARELQRDLDELNKEVGEASKNSLNAREKAIKKAIEEKNEALKKVEEKLLEAEQKKQGKLLEVQGKVSEQAKEAIKKAQEAAIGFRQAVQNVTQIQSGSQGNSSQGSNTSGSSNSNSGKSGGESNSGKSGKD